MDQNFDTFIKQEILNGDEDSFTTVPLPQSNISVKNEPISDELCSFITIKNEPLPEATSIEGCLSVKTKNQLEDQLAVPTNNFAIYELETPPLKSTQILQNNKQLCETSQCIPPIRSTNAAHVTKTQSPDKPAKATVVPTSASQPPILLNAQLRKRHKVVLSINPINKRNRYNIAGTTKSYTRVHEKISKNILNKSRSLNKGNKKIINHLIKKKHNGSKQEESSNISDQQPESLERTPPINNILETPVSPTLLKQTPASADQTKQKVTHHLPPIAPQPTKPEICLPAKHPPELRVKCLCSLIADDSNTSTGKSELREFFSEMFEETRRLCKKQQRTVKISLLQAISDAEDLMERGKCCGFY